MKNAEASVEEPISWEVAENYLRCWIQREDPTTPNWKVGEILRWRKDLFDMAGSQTQKIEYISVYKKRAEETFEQRFSQWLDGTLEVNDLSQSDLARRIGSPPSVVSKWVNGMQRPRPEQCQKIAAALGESFLDVMEAAGHVPHDFTLEGDGFRKDSRDEILDLIWRIPESLLVPFVPMFRQLADPAVAADALSRLDRSLASVKQFGIYPHEVVEEEKHLRHDS
jgi:transcriptional regulator with XRE-family HTH domain